MDHGKTHSLFIVYVTTQTPCYKTLLFLLHILQNMDQSIHTLFYFVYMTTHAPEYTHTSLFLYMTTHAP